MTYISMVQKFLHVKNENVLIYDSKCDSKSFFFSMSKIRVDDLHQ